MQTDSSAARTLLLVTSHPGQPSCAQLAREAAAGERPRKDYVELARLIGADVVDEEHMRERATTVARRVARPAGVGTPAEVGFVR